MGLTRYDKSDARSQLERTIIDDIRLALDVAKLAKMNIYSLARYICVWGGLKDDG